MNNSPCKSPNHAPSPSWMAILFFTISGLSAFLLFLIQPIAGKALLPLFGGSASVWTTCLLFFQTILLAGYSYAHLLTRKIQLHHQMWVHSAVLLGATLTTQMAPSHPTSPFTGIPVLVLLFSLLKTSGAPFFALSATAPLLQHWFFRLFPNRSPYLLYSISNAGSLGAVIFFPFLFERFLPLSWQTTLWNTGFVIFAIGCISCAVVTRRNAAIRCAPVTFATKESVTAAHRSESASLWFGFSAAGSILLLTTTEQISQDVAATPLFWMIPLCLYLLSYVICFSRESAYLRKFWIPAIGAACGAAGILIFKGSELPMGVQLALYMIALFVGCMVAHGELARRKPNGDQLTRFYFWTSLGGISGGIVVAVVAPSLFPELWEYSLCWPLLLVLVWQGVSREITDIETEIRLKKIRWILAGGIVLSSIFFVVDVAYDSLSSVYTSRNFYGRLNVAETRLTRCLYHGRTLHGCQPLHSQSLVPAFYYGPESGVGMAQRIYRKMHKGPVRTGIVGLGVGISAAWNQTDDTMTFYEINPAVTAVAQHKFDYLRSARGIIRILDGDARLTLEREIRSSQPGLDILVLDAFSSDAIPLHLLTREAFHIYGRRIRSGGVLAFHISNRHLNLEPLILAAAKQLHMTPFLVQNEMDYTRFILDSTWVILTDNPQFIEEFAKSRSFIPWPSKFRNPIEFTDQYSNIIDLL